MRLFEVTARELYQQSSRQQRMQSKSAAMPESDPFSYKFPTSNTSVETNYGTYNFFKKTNSWLNPDNQPVTNQANVQKLNSLWAKSVSKATTASTPAPTPASAAPAPMTAPATPTPATKFKTPEEMVDAILALAPPNWLPTITAELLKKQSVAGRKK